MFVVHCRAYLICQLNTEDPLYPVPHTHLKTAFLQNKHFRLIFSALVQSSYNLKAHISIGIWKTYSGGD